MDLCRCDGSSPPLNTGAIFLWPNGHHTIAEQEEHHHRHGDGPDEHLEGRHRKHDLMAATIKDCDVLLARGMGHGAYEGMMQHNIKPVVTDIRLIDEAAKAVIEGTIVDHTERLH